MSMAWLKKSVADVYLASGVANPCLENNRIGHCWAAVLLSDNANPSDFGLPKLTDQDSSGKRLAYIEGTTPVSWGWTDSPGDTNDEELLFDGVPLRKGDRRELEALHFLFSRSGRLSVPASIGSRSPFEVRIDPDMFKSELDTKWLKRLHAKNSRLTFEELEARIKLQFENYKKYLVTLHQTMLCTPGSLTCREVRFHGIDDEDPIREFIKLDFSDPVFGPFWNTTEEAPTMQTGPNKHGSL